MGRRGCCDKSKVKRGSWSPQEDDTLKNYIHKYGTGGNWITLPHKAGLQRCGKSCRLRWLNYLRPNIKHGGFTHDEEFIICNLFSKIGSRWSIIASHLPGRTDNEVKNYWNTKLKKKHMASPLANSDARNTAPAAVEAGTGTTTTSTSTSQIVPINLQTLQDYYFPMPFVYDAPSVSNEPINFSYLEGSSGNNMNLPFYPSYQFSPFCVGVDENSGVKMEEYSGGIWSKEEEAIGTDCDADLFSIFLC
ncbi:hypothetical protein ACS0TY_012342 [Phlomoides rotata]